MREIHQPDGKYRYAFGSHPGPIARVALGETVASHPVDAFDELTTAEQKRPALPMPTSLPGSCATRISIRSMPIGCWPGSESATSATWSIRPIRW